MNSNKLCTLCKTTTNNCEECSSASVCTKCSTGYYPVDGVCTACSKQGCTNTCDVSTGVCKACNTGYYLSSGKCLKCSDNCDKCESMKNV